MCINISFVYLIKILDKSINIVYNIQVWNYRGFCKGLCDFIHNSRDRREGKRMSEVRVRENESLDSALRRFKRQCAMSGIMSEVRKREHYDKPSVKRKKKAEAAIRKNAKR